MKKPFLFAFSIMILTGCYCKKYFNQNSSVRFLRGNHAFTICYQAPGFGDGKKVLSTAYTADPYFARQAFPKNLVGITHSQITYTSKALVGLRMETFFQIGNFPGPLLGIGFDYSRNQVTGNYTTPIHRVETMQNHQLQQQRILLSFNGVTWIRHRMMGYFSFQPGCEWSKQKITSNLQNIKSVNKNYEAQFTARFGYGFQFYIRPLVAFNLELGYGAGAYLRAGIGVWLF